MLKFFRRLRLKLIDEGNLKRYLLYAIGEILLVMIGILLALQVNNWNEGRKENQFEVNLVLELRENLQNDIALHNNEIIIQREHMGYIDGLARHLQAKLPYHDSLNFIRVVYLERYQVNRTAYESLKNRGFELLSSKELKTQMSKYYDIDVIARSKIIDRLNEEQRNALDRYQWKIRENYQGGQDYNKFIFHLASQGSFYINYLYDRKAWKNDFINDFLEPNIQQAKALISIIDEVYKE